MLKECLAASSAASAAASAEDDEGTATPQKGAREFAVSSQEAQKDLGFSRVQGRMRDFPCGWHMKVYDPWPPLASPSWCFLRLHLNL